MQLMEAMKARHSVRSFTDEKITGDIEASLQAAVSECNAESGLNIQLILNEPAAFSVMMARFGGFHNCKNYFAISCGEDSDEACGYYGEKLVILAQALGLNTCWVAISYGKGKVPVTLKSGEKLRIVIALGYGVTQGTPHRSKDMSKLCQVDGDMPDWFKSGMEAAMLAPTAMNQQKFLITLSGNVVTAKAFPGACSKIDLGIVKYHFELGAGEHEFTWGG